MTKSPGNGGFASRPTLGRWFRVFLGLVMLLSAATQVAAVPVAHADSGPVLLHAADIQVESGGSGDPLHPVNECVTFACHGFWLVAGPDAGVLDRAGATATPDHDRSIAGNVVLPPLHPPKNSPHV
jgi:hypothetical protein